MRRRSIVAAANRAPPATCGYLAQVAPTHLMQSFSYGESINAELLKLMGELRGPVLDIGCGVGVWASELRRLGPRSWSGSNRQRRRPPRPATATTVSSARRRDPRTGGSRWRSLRARRRGRRARAPRRPVVGAAPFHGWTQPGGQLAVSVPNLRYYRVSLALVLAGRFEYQPSGVMDWTHLRWFTQTSLQHALTHCGWRPIRWGWALAASVRCSVARPGTLRCSVRVADSRCQRARLSRTIRAASLMPRVSVLIPTFSRPDELIGCIDAVLASLFEDFELLVGDDGKLGRAVCERVPDPRFGTSPTPAASGWPATGTRCWTPLLASTSRCAWTTTGCTRSFSLVASPCSTRTRQWQLSSRTTRLRGGRALGAAEPSRGWPS